MANKALALYQSKRDFNATPEPTEATAVSPARYPRFVIQKHAASHLHYDLRLEVDGVFKSWAVSKGPSLDPRDKRLAVAVEDHPLAYGDFEGPIPKGQYGGGTVMLWDRGFWTPDGHADAAQALRRGELKFTMAGNKLKGGWVLVRLRRDGARNKRNDWLLIKHRDGFAREGGGLPRGRDRSVASGRNLAQIAEGKGRAPSAFMAAAAQPTDARAVWISNREQRASSPRARAQAAKAARERRGPASDGHVLGVTLSHPDKELWPAAEKSGAVSKRQLATYLEQVGPWMLEHIHGRPCSIVRAPDGIQGQRFFQRHAMPGLSEFVTVVAVEGEPKPYLEIDRVEGLIALAQLAAVEFHPWNGVPHAPQQPGRLIFDLDPGEDVAFGAVVAAARELRERLERLGLVAFCKTTGGKGLHVVTPLRASGNGIGWDEAKRFAQRVSSQMAGDSPTRYLVNMRKTLRAARIYLDYLRNDRTATAVAPLSPRARPGAPVSMPLSWGQVRGSLDPGRFTIASVPRLLARWTAWKDYAVSARPLKSAISKLSRDHA
jgi:bifunctional non-homologous end joining protein LigD